MAEVRSKNLIGNLILISISVSVSLLAAEFVLRMAFPVFLGSVVEYRIPHPVMGWSLEPDASYLYKIPETTVHVSYNSSGWRDTAHSISKERDTFRIVVLGDSFMEAYSVELQNSFHKRLEKIVGQEAADVEVINLGVGGYGTLQEYLSLVEFGSEYKPDLVLLAFFARNDLSNNSFELESSLHVESIKIDARPFLKLDGSVDGIISSVDYAGAKKRYDKAKAQQSSFPGNVLSRSALVRTIRLAARSVKHSLGDSTDNDWGQAETARQHLALHGSNYCKEPPEFADSWEITARIFQRLKKQTDELGSRLLVFSVPALHEVDTAEMHRIAATVPDSAMMCIEDAPATHRLRDTLDKLDIAYVDLLPTFRSASRDDGLDLYWVSDRHWNESGHSLAADVVGAALLDRGLIPD